MRIVCLHWIGLLWVLFGVVPGAAAFPHEGSDVPVDPAVHFGVLENGLRYAIMPNAEPPERVSLRLFVGAGSAHERDDQRGLAHFLEHMAFKGSTNYSPGELIAFLQSLGMAFGPDTNAHTGFDETVYKLELPNNEDSLLDEGLRVMRDYADQLLIRTEELEPERGVILAEKRDRDSVRYRRFVAQWSFIFAGTILPERFPIGLRPVIETAGRDLFVDFYETWYRPDNMMLIVAGAVDPVEFAARIETIFADMERPEEPLPELELGTIQQPPFEARLHVDREATSTDLSIVALRPHRWLPDTLATRRESILADIGFAVVNQRFERLQEEAEAPFLRAGTYRYDFLRFFELAAVDLSADPGQWEAAAKVAENELRRALLYGFAEDEIAEVSAKLLAAARDAVAAAPTRRSRPLADQLMRTLANDSVFTTPEFDLEFLEGVLAEVEPAAVLEAFAEIWSPPGRFFFVSTSEAPEDGETGLRRVFREAEAQELEDIVRAELPEWPYRASDEPGAVLYRAYHEDLGIHALRFANGLRVNIKTTDFEAGRVRVALRIGAGQLAHEPDARAVSFFAERAFLEGGLGSYSRNDWGRVLAGQTVSLGFSVEQDHLRLSGATSPDDFLTQMELMAAHLADAGWREDGIALARRRLAPFYRSLTTTVDGVFGDAVQRYLAGGDPRFGVPEQGRVEAVSVDAMRGFLEPMLRSGYLELSVVGAIEAEAVETAVAATLGTLAPRLKTPGSFEERRQGPKFPEVEEELRVFSVESDLPRALSVVAFPTVDRIREIDTSRTLNVVASILRDRLRIAIREKLGEAYSPSAFNQSSEVFSGYGVFFAMNGTDPGATPRMTELIAEIVSGLLEEPISEDEFDRAIRPLLSFLDQYVRDNGYWLERVLLSSQAQPWHLDWARTLRSSYEAMTLAEVQAVAEEFLRDTPLLRIGIEPSAGDEDANDAEE